MKKFLNDFVKAMVELNHEVLGHQNNGNQYKDGIGPYGEDQIVDMVMRKLSGRPFNEYVDFHIRPSKSARKVLGLEGYVGLLNEKGAEKSATPDLILNNRIIEFKIARPLGDNGLREDTWFKKVFEPNPDSYSTFLDVEKLCRFSENHDRNGAFEKWVVIIGFERLNETEYNLDEVFPGLFKYVSEVIRKRPIREYAAAVAVLGDHHPFHQVVKLYGFRY
jgi:hypothetical protein